MPTLSLRPSKRGLSLCCALALFGLFSPAQSAASLEILARRAVPLTRAALRAMPPRSLQKPDGFFNVLAVDGGSIRGVVALEMLKAFEENVEMPVSSKFDLVVGASVGGALASTLTVLDRKDGKSQRYLAADLLDLSPQLIKGFFKFDGPIAWRLARNGFGLCGSILPDSNLLDPLHTLVGTDLLAQGRTERMLLTFNMTTGLPQVFSSYRARTFPQENYRLASVMAGSAAIPVLFPAIKVCDDSKNRHYYADGGIAANSPSVLAFAEAMGFLLLKKGEAQNSPIRGGASCLETRMAARYYSENIGKIRLLSIGCGSTNVAEPGELAKNWGLFKWLPRSLSKLLSSQEKLADETMKEIFEGQKGHYFRFNPDVSSLNAVQKLLPTASGVARLREIGQEVTKTEEFKKMCNSFRDDIAK